MRRSAPASNPSRVIHASPSAGSWSTNILKSTSRSRRSCTRIAVSSHQSSPSASIRRPSPACSSSRTLAISAEPCRKQSIGCTGHLKALAQRSHADQPARARSKTASHCWLAQGPARGASSGWTRRTLILRKSARSNAP